jgi:hypothetical protein
MDPIDAFNLDPWTVPQLEECYRQVAGRDPPEDLAEHEILQVCIEQAEGTLAACLEGLTRGEADRRPNEVVEVLKYVMNPAGGGKRLMGLAAGIEMCRQALLLDLKQKEVAASRPRPGFEPLLRPGAGMSSHRAGL